MPSAPDIRADQSTPARPAAPFLPMSLAEMHALGWDQCDVILVTGDAYVDHPSFGMAIIGRVLKPGLWVGIIADPIGTAPEPFKALGRLWLMFVSRPATWIRWSIAIRRIAVYAVMMLTRLVARAAGGRIDQ